MRKARRNQYSRNHRKKCLLFVFISPDLAPEYDLTDIQLPMQVNHHEVGCKLSLPDDLLMRPALVQLSS